MGKILWTDGTGIPPRSFEQEFLSHKKCNEWWYCTGYLKDGKGGLYGYQFTFAKVSIKGIGLHLLISSVTDFQTGKHYNTQTPILFRRGIRTEQNRLVFGKKSYMEFSPNGHSPMGHMVLHMENEDFSVDTVMDAAKPPVRHCEDGVLQMGIPDDPKEQTYYMSFTNLTTTGTLRIEGRTLSGLTGKTWFDRQGGTYTLTDPRTQWEWFSLRFFDGREMMLFAFDQDGYFDGTRIEADGSYTRLQDYRLTATKLIEYNSRKFSNEWTLDVDGKHYHLVPRIDGMYNVMFFELLADIFDEDGTLVGCSFVELCPGVRNPNHSKSKGGSLFTKKA